MTRKRASRVRREWSRLRQALGARGLRTRSFTALQAWLAAGGKRETFVTAVESWHVVSRAELDAIERAWASKGA